MTAKELNHRKRIIRAVIGSQELEGALVTPQTKQLLEELASGKLTDQDLQTAIRRIYTAAASKGDSR
ncbi:antitoxin VbhA family protein [Actinomyces bowdenii]|uniref:antitoxin VbhA family protein n=1 Tax=Actinomyces bowdenii TaxID=131109 RepID=UPI001ABD127E|nr:antitoxin VbhA family protein [Actinomyces bowdenii]MBO3724194.1 antitoxin VbhA family protein [Actinomyces bowdenii]